MPNCVIGFLARHRRVISSDAARPLGGRAAESRDLVVKMHHLLKSKHKVPRLRAISASLKSRSARDDSIVVSRRLNNGTEMCGGIRAHSADASAA